MNIHDLLNSLTVHTQEFDGDVLTITLLTKENVIDLGDYKVRNKIVAQCVAMYPRCAQGVSSIDNGVVTMKFVRAFA